MPAPTAESLQDHSGEPTPQITLGTVLDAIFRFVKTPTGALTVIAGVGLLFAFQHLVGSLEEWWFKADYYYTHGPLIPFLSAYIIWDRREKIASVAGITSKGDKVIAWAAAALIVPWLFLTYIASRTDLETMLSLGIVSTLILGSVFLYGHRKTWYALPGLLYAFLGFPVGRGLLDRLTNPLQAMSTSSAYHFMQMFGLHPMQVNANQLAIGDYQLYVAAACAGLGMSLSVFAFVVLFMLIGKLKWWGNVIMLAIWMPLVIIINGVRIAMIGIVGDYMGDAAAGKFHDWSGYISLVLMFFILMKLTRALGWK